MGDWIVIVPHGIFTKCYGLFKSHDLAMAWVRANQFEVEDVRVHIVNKDEPEGQDDAIGAD